MKLCLLLLTILLNKCYSETSGRRPSLILTNAVSKAAEYLLKSTDAENGGKNIIPRTVVALAFAVRNGIIPDVMLSSLKKKLDIQIYVHLSQTHLKPSLFELAQYVNALYATCQDPRSFHGMNLVAQLRANVESACELKPPNVISPFPLLTLCIAGDGRKDDFSKLKKNFKLGENDRLSSKALIVLTLECLKERHSYYQLIREFIKDVRLEFNTTDIYTKSLSVQALHALHLPEADAKLTLLQQHQLPNGSFGDLLSTYYAIPALLNKSLLDLRCESSREQRISRLWDSFTDDLGKVIYSLWIDQGSLSITHSVKIALHPNETFYDVMRRAEEENEAFSFLYDSTRTGKKVYSLAGIPNDAESRKTWNLYQGFEGDVKINSKQNLLKLTRGVDQIWPRDNDYFVFWFEYDSN